ncbi:MAG: hypothetical protein K2W95_13980 [Candidatus Obscuribacterales bacterium]|nr:hypothetical protein [Candidatus Obscuribacterales bacterium]
MSPDSSVKGVPDLSSSNEEDWCLAGRFKHIAMLVPSSNLLCDSQLIDSINRICAAGSRLSIICPPQEVQLDELREFLSGSAIVYALPVHMPQAECYDLSEFLGRSLSSPYRRLTGFLLETGFKRSFAEITEVLPQWLRRPLSKALDLWHEKVLQIRRRALSDGRYWQHYLLHQLPKSMYRRYEESIRLDCFGYFYVIQTLLLNKSHARIEAVYCNYFGALPAACLIKELLDVPLIYDSHGIGTDSIRDPDQRAIAASNEKWMYNFCDQFISPVDSEPIRSSAVSTIGSRFQTLSLPPESTDEQLLPEIPRRLNVCILLDEFSANIGTVYEHLNSFRQYLPHNVSYLPATTNSIVPVHVDLSVFDVVIVHYSVRLSLSNFIDANIAQQLADFSGLKILFIQDEYDTTETARCWMEKLRFDIVYTCVPQESLELIYPKTRFPKTDFLPTLTGYVPEDPSIDCYATPLEQRELIIAYRGRVLPYHYGALAYEKYLIGVEVKRLAKQRGIPVNIEVDDHKRIYGSDWYRFLSSSRSTLGTESGSNVFDFEGKLKESVVKALAKNCKRTFQDIHQDLLAEHEGLVKMNQVSPKIFEAIRLRTALVLFEGNYSGVVKADEHFVPLKKDFSNIDEVFNKLQDLEYLRKLTERAYSDVIESGRYSYCKFIEAVNADITERVPGRSFDSVEIGALSRKDLPLSEPLYEGGELSACNR